MRSLPSLYKALTLLQRSALLAFEEERADDAVDSLVALLIIGRSAADIPTLSGFLRGARSRTDALGVLERGMHRMVLTDEQLQRVQAALWTDDTPEMLERALASHRCLLLPRLEGPSRYPDDSRFPIPVLEAYEALGLAAREGTVFLGAMESYMEVTRRSLHQWQAEVQRIDAAVQERLFGCVLLGSDGGFSFSHIPMGYLKRVARLRTAQVALAVERYHLAHGALPVSLEDLAPGYLNRVPQDPYTGQDLRYEKLGTSFVVYSVGEDGRDDGGWEEPPHDRRVAGQTYDITFTVER